MRDSSSGGSSGISSIMGEILIVLIIVAIAALVYTHVTESGVKPEESHISKLFRDEATGDKFTVTFHGGMGSTEIVGIKIIVNGEEFVNYSSKPKIGDTWVFEAGKSPQGPGALSKVFNPHYGKNDDRLVIVGEFSDGYEAVLVNTYV